MQAPSFKDLGFGLALGGAAAVAVGSFLVMDDVHDFGEIISYGKLLPWEPSTEGIPHLHHGLLGLLLLVLGAFLMLLGLIFLLKAFILKT
jgi:hypothetical protein